MWLADACYWLRQVRVASDAVAELVRHVVEAG